jgi:hypothetical protein
MIQLARRALTLVAALAIFGWGVTYVPVLNDSLPSLMTAPTPTVRFDLGDLSTNDLEEGRFPAWALSGACDRIPFLLRPIAGKPQSLRVVLHDGQVDVGEVVYDCRDGAILSDRMF